MGKLRIEPKSSLIDPETYRHLLNTLRDARNVSENSKTYYDLDKDEQPAQLKREFKRVADKEGMDVQIRSIRNAHALEFTFREASPTKAGLRMSADEYREQVLAVIAKAKRPLKKSDILNEANLSGSTWNIRIKELLKAGKVVRKGERRDATYTLK